MKNKLLILYIIIFAVLVGGAYFLYNRLAPMVDNNNLMTETDSQGQVEQGTESEKTAPKALDFTVTAADGTEVKLSDLEGKPVIVNFWASWCGPCKNEMPDFEEKFKEYGDEIHFMMINVTDGGRETVDSAKSFIEDSGYTFPVYYDTTLEASNLYGIYSLPTSLFIDAEGYGIAQATGMINAELLQKGIDTIYTPEE